MEKETKGKVVDLIQCLELLTAMVLENHIFFKGKALRAKWEKPFNLEDASKSSPFLVGKGTTVQVLMMHQVEQFAFGVDLELNCRRTTVEKSWPSLSSLARAT